MPEEKRYEFLEHTADVYVEAHGSSFEEALESAALATTEVMTDTEKVRPLVEEEVEIEAWDEGALLYSWIEELLVRFDTSGNLYSRFEVSCVEEAGEGLRLRARIWGEAFDPERHPQRLGIKAVTYHRMEIDRRPGEVTLRFVLDV